MTLGVFSATTGKNIIQQEEEDEKKRDSIELEREDRFSSVLSPPRKGAKLAQFPSLFMNSVHPSTFCFQSSSRRGVSDFAVYCCTFSSFSRTGKFPFSPSDAQPPL